MKTVWKFPIQMSDRFEVDMPVAAQILRVQTQGHAGHIWALVDPMAARETRLFAVHGTGHDIPNDDRRYVGTFDLPMLAGHLVFHLFELSK